MCESPLSWCHCNYRTLKGVVFHGMLTNSRRSLNTTQGNIRDYQIKSKTYSKFKDWRAWTTQTHIDSLSESNVSDMMLQLFDSPIARDSFRENLPEIGIGFTRFSRCYRFLASLMMAHERITIRLQATLGTIFFVGCQSSHQFIKRGWRHLLPKIARSCPGYLL